MSLTKTMLGGALLLFATASSAAPFFPAPGPTSVDFVNREQICSSCILAGDTTSELNWGIAVGNNVSFGVVTEPGATIEVDTSLDPQFSSGAGAQITAMFYGLTLNQFDDPSNTLESTGGFLDVYYDEVGLPGGGTIVNIATLLPGARVDLDTYPGITDGVLLAHLAFAAGVNPFDGNTTITGTSAGFPSSITGISAAEGYANVVLGSGGLWETILDTDFFVNSPAGAGPLAFGSRDIRFRNTFSSLGSWSGECIGSDGEPIAGSACLGAASSDPITFFIPEPGSLLLMASVMFGMGLIGRVRRRR